MTTFAERVEARVALLYEACREKAIFLSGDSRVSEADAAPLLGVNRGYLKELRQSGKGPSYFRVPLNGSRICYDLRDLATWIELGRDAAGNDS